MASGDSAYPRFGDESHWSDEGTRTTIPAQITKHYENQESVVQKIKAESDNSNTGSKKTTSPTSLNSVKDLERRFRYLKFQDYDFTKDDQFQVGWKKLSAVVPTDQNEQQLLKAKLFYYSKHVEPIDVNDYLTWKETNSNKKDQTESIQEVADSDKGDNSCSSDVQASAPTNDSDMPLTFSDVVEIIQSGKTIPGLKKIDIKPTETDPSPSVLERKSKPWES